MNCCIEYSNDIDRVKNDDRRQEEKKNCSAILVEFKNLTVAYDNDSIVYRNRVKYLISYLKVFSFYFIINIIFGL